MRFFKKHLTKPHIMLGISLMTVIILSLGTVSAAYYTSNNATKAPSTVVLPKQITLIENNKAITLTPTALGWSAGRAKQSILVKQVTAIADSTQKAPVDAKIVQRGGDYVISPSAPGQKVDVNKAVKMVKAGLFAGQSAIRLPIVAVSPTVVEASLQPQLQQLKAQQAAKLAAAQIARSTTPTSCADNPVGRKLILVNLSRQHLWACNGGNPAYETAITSGAYLTDTRTPTGTWRIYSKSTNINLTGPGYSYPVSYWMAFYADYGFHDSSWQTFPYGSAEYASQGSHGCVHVPAAAMAWLYGWAPVGTTVMITG